MQLQINTRQKHPCQRTKGLPVYHNRTFSQHINATITCLAQHGLQYWKADHWDKGWPLNLLNRSIVQLLEFCNHDKVDTNITPKGDRKRWQHHQIDTCCAGILILLSQCLNAAIDGSGLQLGLHRIYTYLTCEYFPAGPKIINGKHAWWEHDQTTASNNFPGQKYWQHLFCVHKSNQDENWPFNFHRDGNEQKEPAKGQINNESWRSK